MALTTEGTTLSVRRRMLIENCTQNCFKYYSILKPFLFKHLLNNLSNKLERKPKRSIKFTSVIECPGLFQGNSYLILGISSSEGKLFYAMQRNRERVYSFFNFCFSTSSKHQFLYFNTEWREKRKWLLPSPRNRSIQASPFMQAK